MAATRGSDDQTTNTNEGRRRFSFFPPAVRAQEDAEAASPREEVPVHAPTEPVVPAPTSVDAPVNPHPSVETSAASAEVAPAPEAPSAVHDAPAHIDMDNGAPHSAESFPGSGYTPVVGRIPIFKLRPQIEDELWPTKAVDGDVVPFSCVSFREGHDLIGVELVIEAPDGSVQRHRMRPGAPGTDTWECRAQLHGVGIHRWHVEAWADVFATWRHNAEIKIAAGVDVEIMLEQGARLAARAGFSDAAETARTRDLTTPERLAALLHEDMLDALERDPLRELVTSSPERLIDVNRKIAGVAAWYELFPRSEGAIKHDDGSWTSGTFRTAAERLPAVREMGFDVVYLPPIHPIGRTNRKGPNNTLTAGPNDPGSPWAIGAREGGHTDIHPELGTIEDFRFFRGEVERLGMELALDIALQATPDHPWVSEHEDWFTQLPDGSIAYAENPPKKYQDIYPLNFDGDRNGLYTEILEMFEYWISEGVKIFRIDNPHTKPLQFWEWVIYEVRTLHPEVVFLAEAFTRPAIMQGLAQAGFQQSYSYFTWRNTKEELEEFLTSVSKDTSAFMRPNLFVNTPDILTEYLQFGGRAAYEIRATIAAMAGPLWGMYAGYELIENVARPGAEENIDNEKYEFKQRDWAAEEAAGRSIAPYVTKLNEIRHAHPALEQLTNFELHYSSSDDLLVFSKHLAAEHSPNGVADTIIVVVALNPHNAVEATVWLDPTKFGLNSDSRFEVEDLVSGSRWEWGTSNYVRLDPHEAPAHILHVTHR